MNYLQSLIRVLSPEERELLTTLSLSPKEQQLLHALMKDLDSGKDAKPQIMQTMGWSSSFFDKTCSVLLTKAYTVLAPENENAIFVFLNRKNLDALNRHELNKREKQLLKEGDSKALDAFFLSAFMMARSTNFDRYDPELCQQYAHKYLNNGSAKSSCEHARIQLLHLFVLLHYLNSVHPKTFDAVALHEEIDKCEALLNDECEANARFELLKTRATLQRIEGRLEEGIDNLERALRLCEEHNQKFRPFDAVFVQLQIAEMLRDVGRFAESFELYHRLFENHENMLSSLFYHINRYAESAVLNKQADLALRVLEKYLARFIDGQHTAVATNACLSFAKALIVAGRFDEAQRYVQLGFQLGDKTLFFDAEIELRNLQVVCCFLEQDFATAEMLAQKSIKFLRSKKQSAAIRQYTTFYTLCLALIDLRLSTKKLSKKAEQAFEFFSQGKFGAYRIMLELMRGT